MKVIERDIWLCNDCVVLHETGDSSSFDYHYLEDEAERRLKECETGLEALGPHLVSDNWDASEHSQHECRDCGHIGETEEFQFRFESEDQDEAYVCPQCGSDYTEERDSGRNEFSRHGCDCCGNDLAGELHRYARLGPDSGEELAVPPDVSAG